MSEEQEIDNELEESTRAHLKTDRQQYLQKLLEDDLQVMLKEAAIIQKKITDAKTNIKKDFYRRKFNKISAEVRKYVSALQRLGALITPEGT